MSAYDQSEIPTSRRAEGRGSRQQKWGTIRIPCVHNRAFQVRCDLNEMKVPSDVVN
jgi:hypothetical protein